MTDLDRLREILLKAGVEDRELAKTIQLTPKGYQKLAAAMNSNVHDIRTMLNTLSTQANSDQKAMREAHARFSYEKDSIGLMVRDGQTGDEKYYRGSDAAHIEKLLNPCLVGSPEEQDILADFAPRTQLEEAEEEPEDFGAFTKEINNTSGSYNFPWRLGSRFGTATAAYGGDELKVDIVDVRDSDGEEMPLDAMMKHDLHKQALAFIDKV